MVATKRMEKTLPMILQWDESFDIGSDTLTGVNDADYKPPFPLTAKLNKLTIKVDRPQLSPEDIKKLAGGDAGEGEARLITRATARRADRAPRRTVCVSRLAEDRGVGCGAGEPKSLLGRCRECLCVFRSGVVI